MESSDDDFAWTGVSSDSEDGVAVKMENSNNDEESESGKNYKKKLQKQLFREQVTPAPSRASFKREPDSDCGSTRRRRKHKHGVKNGARDEPHDDSYLALRVKQEQAFLAPSPRKRKATKRSHDSDTDMDSTNSHSEYSSTKKSKKSKKKKQNNDREDETDNMLLLTHFKNESPNCESSTKKKKSKKRKDRERAGSSQISVEDKFSAEDTLVETQPNVIKMEIRLSERDLSESRSHKKKKSKKRSLSDSTETNDMMIEDKFSAEETVVETRPNNRKLSKPNGTSNEDVHNSKESGMAKITNSTFTSKEFISEESTDDDSEKINPKTSRPSVNNSGQETEADNHSQQISDTPTGDKSRRTTKLSDRIQFEDDDTIDMDTSEITDERRTQSSKVRQFLTAHPHLQALTYKLQGESLISPDDESWILKCPHELDITTLKGTDILLDTDSKCRIKVEGHTYNGTLDNESTRITFLSLEHDEPVIKNIPVMGTVQFRKRIPKAHFMQDNIIQNNQNNFIPLPETKWRHPLFGNNYKTAMKIPKCIKERLNCSEIVKSPEKKKKKKHKKERIDPIEEPEPVPPHSKKRKHKHTDTDEPTPKKKRIKPDMFSADAWDSEKAIEENLFNF